MRSLVLHLHRDWTVMEQNHLSAAEIAGFIDRTLDGDVRANAAEHLATCERCRDEVAACARLAASAPAHGSVSLVWRAAVGIAAVFVLAVGLRSSWQRGALAGSGRSVTTERSTPVTNRVIAVFPTDKAEIPRSQLRFVWQRDAQASGYQLTIADAKLKPIWSTGISDTAFALPDSVRLTPSALYFWSVDAPHVDGSVAQSNPMAFRVAP